MTKDELWKIYCVQNPTFARDDSLIGITGRGIRKLFEQSYDRGHEQGFKNGKAHAEMHGKKDTRSEFDKIFGGLF